MTVKQKIPQAFLDDLIARTDIVEWISERIAIKRSGSNWHGKCPFHQEKSPSFSVSQTKQFYYCFGCKAAGNIFQFIMDYHHYSFLETIELLATAHGLTVPSQAQAGQTQAPAEDFSLMQAIAKAYQDQYNATSEAKHYLQARGLSADTIQSFQLGYAPDEWRFVVDRFGEEAYNKQKLVSLGMAIEKKTSVYDRFRGRIMFPIHNHKGQVIGFGGRVLGNETPKYLNSPETLLFHKGEALFGLYHLRNQRVKIKKILIVEGYMDVIALANKGINYAVATLGTAITSGHIKKCLRHCNTLYFCFDGDLAGNAAAWKALTTALPHIHDGTHIYFCFLPDKEDPDSYICKHGKAIFESTMEKSLPLSDYFFNKLCKQHSPHSLDTKASLAKEACRHLGQMPEGIFQTLLYKRLSELVDIDPSQLKQANYTTNTLALPQRKTPPKKPSNKASPIRQAITLLIHYPEIASKIDDSALCDCIAPGVPQWHQIMTLLNKNPQIKSTGALMQHIEDATLKRQMYQLAGTQVFTQSEEAISHCQALIDQHAQAKVRITIEDLIKRAELGELNQKEKSQLQSLIAKQKSKN